MIPIRESSNAVTLIQLYERPYPAALFPPVIPPILQTQIDSNRFMVLVGQAALRTLLSFTSPIPIATQLANRAATSGFVTARLFHNTFRDAETEYISQVQTRLGITLEPLKYGKPLSATPDAFPYKRP